MFAAESLVPLAYLAVLAVVLLSLHVHRSRTEFLLWSLAWGGLLARRLVIETGPGAGRAWTAAGFTVGAALAFFLGGVAFARAGSLTRTRAVVSGVGSGVLAAALVVALRTVAPEASPERTALGVLSAGWIGTGWIVARHGTSLAPVGSRLGGFALLAWGAALPGAVALAPALPEPVWMIVVGTILGGLAAAGMIGLAFESDRVAADAGRVDPRLLLDDDPNMIVVVQDGALVFANRAVEKRLGYTEREIEAFDLYEPIDPERRDEARERFRARKAGVRIEDYELDVLDAEGEPVPVLVHADSIVWEGRDAFKYELTDLSSTKRAREELERINAELEQVNRLQSEFLSNTTHELKTPLTSIIANTEILEYEMCGPVNAEQRRVLESISRNSQQLLEMISELLDFARKREGHDAPHYEEVAVRTVIDGVVETVRPMVEEKGLTIETEIAPEAERAWLDAGKVYRVYLNLTENAIKFSSGGTIRLAAEAVDGEFEGSVEDEGIGIPEEKHEEIFESFRQVDASSTRSYGGVGLGLTICRQLVELHGGRIWVESEPGEGSRFVFRIPGPGTVEPVESGKVAAPGVTPE